MSDALSREKDFLSSLQSNLKSQKLYSIGISGEKQKSMMH